MNKIKWQVKKSVIIKRKKKNTYNHSAKQEQQIFGKQNIFKTGEVPNYCPLTDT